MGTIQVMKTQVAIIGAGPAGLLLSHLLHLQGISSVVLESRSRAHVEARIRAGVLEQGTVDVLNDTGVGARMQREGLRHTGFDILFDGAKHRIALDELTSGKCITVYGQHEVVKDLIAQRLADGGQLLFEAEVQQLSGVDSDAPQVRYTQGGIEHTLDCDFIAGCDGFHGICRAALPASVAQHYDKQYPFAWLGILVQAPPAQHELIYAHHEHGFALFSMRSPTVTRLYVQCDPHDDIAQWPDERIWDELFVRLDTHDGWRPNTGPILQKGITAMRSFVCEPMQHGRLFLAGDAAHIVPPTGAKGMNLAVADVRMLARALHAHYAHGDERALKDYSSTCLRRVWKGERFSWHMTSMLHQFPEHEPFQQKMQLAELAYYTGHEQGRKVIAENYVGLPFDA
jgi:p-hydroxybenzoate 3-monooxygenase